ncbi:unnamed protein product, partial [Chrysoparadoxa australica]
LAGACSNCDGGLVSLTFRYDGATAGNVRIIEKKDSVELFNATAQPGQKITVVGTRNNNKFGANEVRLFSNQVYGGALHTS